MIQSLLNKISRTPFVQSAIDEQADLSAFKERPTPRIIFGLFLIGFSYIIGWPAVTALGMLSVYYKEPLLVGIGGPLVYGLSHLVFIAGMWVAGAKYTRIFLRWAARMFAEKFTSCAPSPSEQSSLPELSPATSNLKDKSAS